MTKSSSGVLELDAAPTFNNSSQVVVNGSGTLRFKVAGGSATVGTGVTAQVNNSATLELAGSVSALASSANQAAVANNSTAPAGLLISGTNQQLGAITGTGNTVIDAGSQLTATSLIQGSLVIGGTSTSAGLVTIADSTAGGAVTPSASPASDLLASPTDATDPTSVSSTTPSLLPAGTSASLAALAESPLASPASPCPAAGTGANSLLAASSTALVLANPQAVPEPSSVVLLILAMAILVLVTVRRQRSPG